MNIKESYLLNKKIAKVNLINDTELVFTLRNGESVHWLAYGDCCSETWFENISGLGRLRDNMVVEIIEREIPELVQKALNPYRQESDELYGYTLKVNILQYGEPSTRFDTVDIEFRNSSNGYYGGWIEETVIGSEKVLVEEEKVRIDQNEVVPLRQQRQIIGQIMSYAELTKLLKKYLGKDGKLGDVTIVDNWIYVPENVEVDFNASSVCGYSLSDEVCGRFNHFYTGNKENVERERKIYLSLGGHCEYPGKSFIAFKELE